MAMDDPRYNPNLVESSLAPVPSIDPAASGSTVSDGVNETNGNNEGSNSALEWFNSLVNTPIGQMTVLHSHDSDGNNSVASAILANGIKEGKITAHYSDMFPKMV